MGQHDDAYKDFFSQRERVADLLRAFVPRPRTEEIAFDPLARVNASFVEGARRDRESDVIWRFRAGAAVVPAKPVSTATQ